MSVVNVSTVVGNKVTMTVPEDTAVENSSRCSERAPLTSLDTQYGVVPEALLTFIGSLFKEVAKTTPGTLV